VGMPHDVVTAGLPVKQKTGQFQGLNEFSRI
jgi:hypothetical protein